MGRLLILSFLFAATNAFAAQPGNAPIVCIGAPGQQTQSACAPLSQLSGGPQQMFSIYAGGSWNSGNFYPLYKNGVAYQVTAGKTAYCFNETASGSATNPFQLVSATAAIVSNTASITGGVYQCGTSATTACTFVGVTASVPGPIPGTITFAASTYVGAQANNTIVYTVHLECFEQ